MELNQQNSVSGTLNTRDSTTHNDTHPEGVNYRDHNTQCTRNFKVMEESADAVCGSNFQVVQQGHHDTLQNRDVTRLNCTVLKMPSYGGGAGRVPETDSISTKQLCQSQAMHSKVCMDKSWERQDTKCGDCDGSVYPVCLYINVHNSESVCAHDAAAGQDISNVTSVGSGYSRQHVCFDCPHDVESPSLSAGGHLHRVESPSTLAGGHPHHEESLFSSAGGHSYDVESLSSLAGGHPHHVESPSLSAGGHLYNVESPALSASSAAHAEESGTSVETADTDTHGTHHSQPSLTQQKPYYCLQCHKAFATSHNLIIHARAHAGEEPHQCMECSAYFSRKYDLKRHAGICVARSPIGRVTHRRKTGCRIRQKARDTSQRAANPEKQSHGDKTVLRQEVKKSGDSKPFKCSECPLAFPQLSRLRKHIRTHTGEKPFLCSQCSASFTRRSDLTRHSRTHSGEKPFHCSMCPAAFATSCKLTMHTRTHTGEKPYQCFHCPAAFARKTDLNMHVRTHTGEKPHMCTECAASFTTTSKLKVHFRIHTGERPFHCSLCPAAFTQSAGLKKHMRTHSQLGSKTH